MVLMLVLKSVLSVLAVEELQEYVLDVSCKACPTSASTFELLPQGEEVLVLEVGWGGAGLRILFPGSDIGSH